MLHKIDNYGVKKTARKLRKSLLRVAREIIVVEAQFRKVLARQENKRQRYAARMRTRTRQENPQLRDPDSDQEVANKFQRAMPA
jgi:hypothetical protein